VQEETDDPTGEPDDLPGEPPAPWALRNMSGVCTELDHAADLFLEIHGRDLNGLFGNALFALYSQAVDLGLVTGRETSTIEVCEGSLDAALRALLAEALYRLDADSFAAASARVKVLRGDDGTVRVTAALWGGSLAETPEARLTEIKAVTYHRLGVSPTPDGGWSATVLFDV
jgi:SHS2 domain-containing protein